MSVRTTPLAAVTTAFALVLTALVAVVALAAPAEAAGTVTVTVQGKGTVTGPGIDCSESAGPDCSEFYPDEQDCDPERQPPCINITPVVTLVAAADRDGFTFDHFTGCTSTSGRSCDVRVNASKSVTAVFRDNTPPFVSLTSPAAGPQRGTISLAATANDNVAVQRVEFRVRNVMVGSDVTAPYQASFNSSSISDGTAQVVATAVDTVGNVSANSIRTITVDNTVPALAVTGPNDETFGPGSTQTWTIAASDATTGPPSVQCSVVSAGSPASFGACSNGSTEHSVTDRAEGDYALAVRATDGAGNFSVVDGSFTIDATPPDTSVTSGPADGATLTSRTVTFGLAATESGSSLACRLYPAATTPPVFAACSSANAHTASGLADGSYVFEVRAIDAVGNVDASPATRSFQVDATPPDTSVTSGPADGGVVTSGTVSFGVAATESGSTFACRLYPAATTPPAFAACSSANAHTASGLADGSYVFEVRAIDAVGNVDASPATRSFQVDATPPDTTVTSGPADGATLTSRSVSFGVATEAGATLACRLFPAGTAPPAFAPCTTASSFSASGLTDGSYVFEARATDAAGNLDTTPASRSFRIDATAPSATVTKKPKAVVKTKKKMAKVSFAFEASEPGSAFRCSLDGASLTPCASALSLKVKVGKHVLQVVAVDAAGNVQPTPTVVSWKVKRVTRHH